MDAILRIAAKYDLVVIEDATEGLGGEFRGHQVGTMGDIGCFSFNGNKLLTTGGGGMLVTRHRAWAERARYLTTQAKDDPIEYAHGEIGYNYRLTNLQAAMGVAQLESLSGYIERKRQIGRFYENAFRGLSTITSMPEESWASSTYWLYTALINTPGGGDSRAVLRELAKRGVQTRPLWQPLHQSVAHAGSQVVGGAVAEQLYRDGLSLPCSVGIRDEDLEFVAHSIIDVVTA